MGCNTRVGSDYRFFFLVVDQDTVRRAFEVVELPVAHGPEEHREAPKTQRERNGNEETETSHPVTLAKRSEFATTTSELSDIASAAINGVTIPASASGTAITL